MNPADHVVKAVRKNKKTVKLEKNEEEHCADLKRPDLRGSFQCDSCTKLFCHSSSLSRHRLTVHMKKTYRCTTCNVTIKTKDVLKEHMYKMHSTQHCSVCNCCNWAFLDTPSFHRHLRIKEIEKQSKLMSRPLVDPGTVINQEFSHLQNKTNLFSVPAPIMNMAIKQEKLSPSVPISNIPLSNLLGFSMSAGVFPVASPTLSSISNFFSASSPIFSPEIKTATVIDQISSPHSMKSDISALQNAIFPNSFTLFPSLAMSTFGSNYECLNCQANLTQLLTNTNICEILEAQKDLMHKEVLDARETLIGMRKNLAMTALECYQLRERNNALHNILLQFQQITASTTSVK